MLTAFAVCVGAAAPACAATTPASPPTPWTCGDRPELKSALDRVTGEIALAGAAVEVVDPACGRWGYASGTADLRTGRPMDVRDRLRIGSITKTFTATTVLQLADEGRLSLDASVGHYLPGLVQGNGYDGTKITVRQLLQQTSGLPDHSEALATADVEWLRHHHFTPQDLVRRALRLPPPAHPWHYSTTNYILAGLLIEKATGRPAEAEISRRIIKPLDLHDTYWPGDAERIRGPHSHSYFTTQENGKAVRVDGTEWNTTAGGTGGALVSTPHDVNTFFAALLDGRLLSPARLAEMRTTVAGDPERLGPDGRYGLGLITEPLSCGGVWTGHTGSTRAGHHGIGAVAPDGRQVTVVVNETPTTDTAAATLLAAVDTALCPPAR
ncbi:serine hydrolase [Streptomyces roseochromogenus]|nr:serine hydrolase [Streptomyces roseochromogenus]